MSDKLAKYPNLKKGVPFKKGSSGNPAGRPKKIPELEKLLANVLGEEKNGMTAAEAILRSLIIKAVKGDVRAAEVLLARGYGLPKQNVTIENTVIRVGFKDK
jgi:hypothetical protein